ncbi:acetyltransferase, gnat family [Ruegeria lacuscaerulensis ITI-1157]|nr:acetyltransferase, gnat family [Ruegeria lacuscaerulensis ITI-1157]SHK09346.1 Acetyltransferase (GNAT) domain-containing protein [Ruegeria lacuscaerulensis ITI-1157]
MFDVFGLSRVLTRAITQLCVADHGNDPDKIAAWTANKCPQAVHGWTTSGAPIWLAARNGQVAAVGGVRAPAEISLLYVDPGHAGRGVGAALLSRLEAELTLSGAATVHLMSTKTALGFYRRNGWVAAGQPADWNGIPQFPLRKMLHPSG